MVSKFGKKEAQGQPAGPTKDERIPREARHEWVSDVGHGTACISKEGRREGRSQRPSSNDLDSRGRRRASERETRLGRGRVV